MNASQHRYQPPSAPVADVVEQEPELGILNPWFSMWTKPRATIQQIVATDPNRYVLALCMLIGIAQTLDRASTRSIGDRLSLGAILATTLVVGPLIGLIAVHLFAWLVRLTGRSIGAAGSIVNIRAALVWSNVPALWTALLWVPEIAIFGNELFSTRTPLMDSSVSLLMLLGALAMAQVVGNVWALVALCKSLGQVQGFSAWKGLGNILLAALVLIVPALLIAFTIVFFAS